VARLALGELRASESLLTLWNERTGVAPMILRVPPESQKDSSRKIVGVAQPREDQCELGATAEGNGTHTPVLLSLRDTDDFPIPHTPSGKSSAENRQCYPLWEQLAT